MQYYDDSDGPRVIHHAKKAEILSLCLLYTRYVRKKNFAFFCILLFPALLLMHSTDFYRTERLVFSLWFLHLC